MPQQQQPAAGYELMQVAEQLDQGFAVVGDRTQLEYEVSVAPVRLDTNAAAKDSRFHPKRLAQHRRPSPGAQVARTGGSSQTPDSSSNTISACWRRALFSVVASAARPIARWRYRRARRPS